MYSPAKSIFRSVVPVALLISFFLLAACHGKEDAKEGGEEKTAATGTPVTVTSISTEPMTAYTDLSATSAFLQKSYVKANLNGYIASQTLQPGKYVTAGQLLFTLKTKEAQSIGNSVNQIKATATGYITQLNHQQGDYVQDGEQLAVISDVNSFAFILNLPYELKQYVAIGNKVTVILPDGKELAGSVASAMPTVDPASQTQNIVIKVPGSKNIPENLVAKVRIVKAHNGTAVSLPKAAILTNDAQTDFWIMKLIDSTTAVKVPVKTGAVTDDRIEIKEPELTKDDKILVTGNYGLPDTAKVVVGQ